MSLLRISHESLDMDSIISDLNSELSLPNKKAILSTTKPTTTTNLNPKQTKQKDNKENESINANKCNTTETKASTVGKQNSQVLPNQRYSETITSEAKVNDPVAQPFYMQQTNVLTVDEDVEGFQRKLDSMIVNFRSETMQEFMRTKKQVLNDQVQTIEAERRRCNTMLGVKQNEIEQLKEALGKTTKQCEELSTRSEGMAFWAGKSKTLLRIKLLEYKAFEGLKQNRAFQKHNKLVLVHKMKHFRENLKRKAFLGWEKQYKEWKIIKNREDFDRSVKLELQHICAQYNKEIESLREKLQEANAIVENEHRTKAMMQENLKKVFMRGVCALNFEAMNLLNPSDTNYQQQVEKEMEKQVMHAMNSVALQSPFAESGQFPSKVTQQPVFKTDSNHPLISPSSQHLSSDLEQAYQERKLMQIESSVNPFTSSIISGGVSDSSDSKKIESKDSLWKPAPIMGRDLTQPSHQTQITSQLRPTNNYVLSNHFNNRDLQGIIQNQVTINKVEEDVQTRVVPGNHTVIQNSSTLPDYIGLQSNLNTQQNQGEGKTIIASIHNTASSKPTNKQNAPASKRVSSAVKKSVVK